ISSLLNLQSKYIKDEHDLELFKDSQSRVKSMAFIHEQSYQSSNFSSIEFSDYIHNLVTYLIHYYVIDQNAIKLKMDVDNVSMDLNTSIPCGLIVNELVSNSLKHAFPGNREGEIYIDLHLRNDHQYSLIVADNGIGLPEGFDFENPNALGLQLVNGLVSQLDGTLKLDTNYGTKFEVIFNKLEYTQRI
ncbi:MAG: sensor histidine kinase, partial [Methanobacterium sp.]